MKSGIDLNKSAGVGLIEALVAALILSAGLLGIAKMESMAISNTGVAGMRSIAAIEASSLAAAMHANSTAYWGAGLAPATITISNNSISDPVLSQTVTCTSAATGCTGAQMAAYDLQQWASTIQNLLPNPGATINCSTSVLAPVTCSIQINWTEKNVSLNTNSSVSTGTTSPTSYTLIVEP
ncbi:MAG TPA: type IV pilus modification protein PilV [Pseudomonadales bacterium]|nr:type IV pilus modification protein PilV [Pseudomonadales bacterium]